MDEQSDRAKLEAELAEISQRQRQLQAALGKPAVETPAPPSGAIDLGGGSVGSIANSGAIDADGDVVGQDKVDGDKTGRDKITVYAEAGAQVVVGGEEAVALSQVNRQSALGKYLIHLIGRNRYLQLQGIR
ncbi:MAG: hypothetical protein GY796_19560, partial [Chloroflexi bacterium]|nr:hypothetical protein [Chloroflexota bacterium]